MSFSRLGAALLSTAAAATVLVAGTSSLALAETRSETPSVVSAELLSAEGAGCNQPAVRLMDGWLDVQARTGGDESLRLDGGAAAEQNKVDVECLLRVRIQLDQPAQVKPQQYLMSGRVSTSAGTQVGHYFESSFDSTNWYGQQSAPQTRKVGPFYQGGGSVSDPRSPCATEVDLSLRVGLSLVSAVPLSANDAVSLDALNGAVVELVADSSACS